MTLTISTDGPGRWCGLFDIVAGGLRAAGRILRRSGLAYLAWRRRRRARVALETLDGRMLSDIGIDRGQIPYLVDYGRRDDISATGKAARSAR